MSRRRSTAICRRVPASEAISSTLGSNSGPEKMLSIRCDTSRPSSNTPDKTLVLCGAASDACDVSDAPPSAASPPSHCHQKQACHQIHDYHLKRLFHREHHSSRPHPGESV
ncbi:hypothetical protein NP493_529g00027 [Ridgeia piscesae]|uniref:Uncharacterized protein n=1 Tax=Ridgeia piscesae TaxID=27915 RepID=A0AAD9NQJ9_RIDPI|nr:hypothetical protein NP493_529g00027 [Ridgeia piscesae]